MFVRGMLITNCIIDFVVEVYDHNILHYGTKNNEYWYCLTNRNRKESYYFPIIEKTQNHLRFSPITFVFFVKKNSSDHKGYKEEF